MTVESSAMRAAFYGRYSSKMQRQTSITDQQRMCRTFVEREGWIWQDGQVYADQELSGETTEKRAAFARLMAAAASRPRPFDVLVVDDTSRVARDIADAVRTLQELVYLGIRVVYIAQGIDSEHEQAETMLAVNSIFDAQFLRQLGKKVRRGIEGQHLRGFSSGATTFGYRSVPVLVPSASGDKLDGYRIDVIPEEAAIVRDIFTWFADGTPLRVILERLAAQQAPAPRGGRASGVWRRGALRHVLANPRYIGRYIYGRMKTVRRPGRSSVARPIPESQWTVVEHPEQRIVDDALWARVQARRRALVDATRAQRQPGRTILRGWSAAHQSKHLLTGLLFCGVCGGAVCVVTNCRIRGVRYRYYGCPKSTATGSAVCTNGVRVRAEIAEQALTSGVREELAKPETLAYLVSQVSAAVQATRDEGPTRRARLEADLAAVNTKIGHLTAAVERGIPSATVLQTLQAREAERDRLLTALARPVDVRRLAILPSVVQRHLDDVARLLAGEDTTRAEMQRLGVKFTLYPQYDVPEGQRPYFRARGEGRFEHLIAAPDVFATLGPDCAPGVGSHKFIIDLPSGAWQGREPHRKRA